MRDVFIYKKQENFRYVFIYKMHDTVRYAIFMKILKLAFIYKNNDTLRYVKFVYTKSMTLYKKQDNLGYVFIYKNPDTLRYTIFHWIFEIGGGGGAFFKCKKQCTFHYIFI